MMETEEEYRNEEEAETPEEPEKTSAEAGEPQETPAPEEPSGERGSGGRRPGNRTLRLSVTGMFCAITAVVTWGLRIPVPATDGYINFGDAVVFLAAAYAGGLPAMAVGGIGGTLADLFGGFSHWAPFTLVIKGAEGLICGALFRAISKKMNANAALMISAIVSAAWMVAGYYFAGVLMYGWAGSLAAVPGNLFQGGVSAGIAFALYVLLGRIGPLKPFLERIK